MWFYEMFPKCVFSQHRPFKPHTEHMWKLPIQVSVPFFLLFFFTFLCRHTFRRQVHVVLLFLIIRRARDSTRKPSGPVLTWSTLNLFRKTNIHEMQTLQDPQNVIGRTPAEISLPVPNLRHCLPLAGPKSWNPLKATLPCSPFKSLSLTASTRSCMLV